MTVILPFKYEVSPEILQDQGMLSSEDELMSLLRDVEKILPERQGLKGILRIIESGSMRCRKIINPSPATPIIDLSPAQRLIANYRKRSEGRLL